MSLISVEFVLLFLFLMILYFCSPKKLQWVILLIFNFVFYFLVSGKLPIYMTATMIVTYFSAISVQRVRNKQDKFLAENKDILSSEEKKRLKRSYEKQRKLILAIGLIVDFGMLVFFKYTDFMLDNISGIAEILGIEASIRPLNLILPIGISFYTFQSTGYIIDVYRKKIPAEKNFFKLALFVSYFPQIIEGPIGRFDKLAGQLEQSHNFSFTRFKQSVFVILWGCIKKLVIADNLALFVNSVSSDFNNYDGFQIIAGMLLYGIQLYADFSGYMDIAKGFSSILGIELAENFRRPYFSTSLAEFWRRWHISLCSWFKDYLFYPIFMSRRVMRIGKTLRSKGHKKAAKNIPTFIAMIIVWFITGLWHGACWTEIVWGLSNGLIMIFSLQFSDVYGKINTTLHIKTDSKIWKAFCIIRTYILVTLLNFICEFSTFKNAAAAFLKVVRDPFMHSLSASYIFPKMIDSGIHICVAAMVACIILFVVSLYEEKHNKSVFEVISEKNFMIQNLICIAMFFFVMLFSQIGNGNAADFMYAQF